MTSKAGHRRRSGQLEGALLSPRRRRLPPGPPSRHHMGWKEAAWPPPAEGEAGRVSTSHGSLQSGNQVRKKGRNGWPVLGDRSATASRREGKPASRDEGGEERAGTGPWTPEHAGTSLHTQASASPRTPVARGASAARSHRAPEPPAAGAMAGSRKRRGHRAERLFHRARYLRESRLEHTAFQNGSDYTKLPFLLPGAGRQRS